MSLRKIIQLNLLLVLGVGLYGVATEEAYWRSVGHSPKLYDYLFWCALSLNGPSGFAADYLSWLIIEDSPIHRLPFVAQSSHDWRFVVQYALWLLLLWLQWKSYDALATWCVGHRGREVALHAAAMTVAAIGSVAAYQAWILGHQPWEWGFIDKYFWFVRVTGVALAGAVLLAYYQFIKRRRAENDITQTSSVSQSSPN